MLIYTRIHSKCNSDISKLFQTTFEHPNIGHFVEWTPTKWLHKLSNPDVSYKTNLGSWNKYDRLVSFEELYNDMLEKGMRDPIIIGVGHVSRRVRIEAGNHRINIFLAKNFEYVPAICYIGDTAITNIVNGSHQGEIMDLKIHTSVDIMGPYSIKQYKRPSETINLDIFKKSIDIPLYQPRA